MGTAVTMVDGLDGLAGGIAALALIGLSVAALPICSGKLDEPFRIYRSLKSNEFSIAHYLLLMKYAIPNNKF